MKIISRATLTIFQVFLYMAHYTITIQTIQKELLESFINTEKEIYIGIIDNDTNWFTLSIQDWEELSMFINNQISKLR